MEVGRPSDIYTDKIALGDFSRDERGWIGDTIHIFTSHFRGIIIDTPEYYRKTTTSYPGNYGHEFSYHYTAIYIVRNVPDSSFLRSGDTFQLQFFRYWEEVSLTYMFRRGEITIKEKYIPHPYYNEMESALRFMITMPNNFYFDEMTLPKDMQSILEHVKTYWIKKYGQWSGHTLEIAAEAFVDPGGATPILSFASHKPAKFARFRLQYNGTIGSDERRYKIEAVNTKDVVLASETITYDTRIIYDANVFVALNNLIKKTDSMGPLGATMHQLIDQCDRLLFSAGQPAARSSRSRGP
jgi:hypothetical protein